MRRARTIRLLAMLLAAAALAIGALPVAASPASITAIGTYVQHSGLSITVMWNAGTDNGSSDVHVCYSANGAAPIDLDSGSSGSQKANFGNKGTYLFGLYKDGGCTTLFQNQTATLTFT
jgi:hypothetical protein